jgi:hypothetical protein
MDLCSERGDCSTDDRKFVGEALQANQVRMRVEEVEPWWCLSICLETMSHAWDSRYMYGAAVVWLSRTHVRRSSYLGYTLVKCGKTLLNHC